MQTFLPYKSYSKSAKALDNKRLNKQILEGYQILKVLSNNDPKAAWRNHPAVKMWRGHENSLWDYVMSMVTEAEMRGIKVINNLANLVALKGEHGSAWGTTPPVWQGSRKIMAKVTTTHKANLYRKDPVYYFDFYPAVSSEDNTPCCDKCQYFWVTHKENV